MKIVPASEYIEKSTLPERYSLLLEKLAPVDDGTTLGELVSILGGIGCRLIAVAGNNASGIDIVDLTNEELDEWTW